MYAAFDPANAPGTFPTYQLLFAEFASFTTVHPFDKNEVPLSERRFLNALAGPNGEEISYFRAGSCCAIKSKNDPFGFGEVLLDNYRVTWKGAKDTISIYINMYDYGTLKAPVGFTIKK